ncbi:ABC transporter substrate-binding protein [Alcaligenaceae bacterium]|nr:ABC transporter substrate-binding protein [Alcaligenaceae bacterium]
MRSIRNSIALAAMSCIVSLAGAGNVVAQEQPKQGGTLVLGTYQAPRHLNGAVQSGMATALPSTQLFASLVRFNDKWEPQPYLAESWQWSDDGKALTVKLRSNAVFHDGKPITSEDVAFSIMSNKANHPFQAMFGAVESVETPDPHTAVFKLSQPHPALLIALSPALSPIIPKHIYGDGTDLKSHPRNSQNVVGSGPFKLKEFIPGKEVVLERFDKFFLEGKPYLDRVVIQINPEDTTLLIGLERGDLQMLPFAGDVTVLRRAQTNKDLVMLDKGYEGIGAEAWLAINTTRKPLDDKRVRQAIAYALDKNFITKALTAGFAKPAIGPIISSSPFAAPDANPYKLDLEKAKQLLDEAGLKPGANGERFKMTIDILPGTVAVSKNVAEYARTQLKKIGVAADLRTSADFPSWAKTVANHDFDMTTDIVWNWGDPVIGVHRTYLSSNIRPIVWTNTQSYRNEKVDEILAQAGIEQDAGKRKALYADFQRLVNEDAPIVYVAEVPYHTLVRKNVGNPPTSIWGPLSPLDEVYLK